MEGITMKYSADTVNLAISKGLADLKVGRDQAEVKIISQGRKGFLGIGKKPAVVEINALASKEIDDKYSNKIETEITDDLKAAEQTTTETKSEVVAVQNDDEDLEDAFHAAGNYLSDIIDQLGIDAEISVTISRKCVYFDFETDQQGLLIGKHGKTINALQILAQAYLDKLIKQHYRVILDVDDYREKRREELQKISKELAQRAVAEKRAFKLGPMPALERKVVHKTLANNHQIKAKSHGNDPYRYVIIAPKFH